MHAQVPIKAACELGTGDSCGVLGCLGRRRLVIKPLPIRPADSFRPKGPAGVQ